MKRLLLVFFFVSAPAFAQTSAEGAFGYLFSEAVTEHQAGHGWRASVTANVSSLWGITVETSQTFWDDSFSRDLTTVSSWAATGLVSISCPSKHSNDHACTTRVSPSSFGSVTTVSSISGKTAPSRLTMLSGPIVYLRNGSTVRPYMKTLFGFSNQDAVHASVSAGGGIDVWASDHLGVRTSMEWGHVFSGHNRFSLSLSMLVRSR